MSPKNSTLAKNIFYTLGILVAIFYMYWLHTISKKYENSEKTLVELNSKIKSLEKKDSALNVVIKENDLKINRIIKDSSYKKQVTSIINNYKVYYDKNNVLTDSARIIFINSLLSRHAKVKLERSYK